MSQPGCGCGCGDGNGDDAVAPTDAAAKSGRDAGPDDRAGGLLWPDDARVLNDAVVAAIGVGIKAESVSPLWAAIDELSALDRAAAAVMQGTALPGEMQAQLGGIEAWSPKLLSGRWGKVAAAPALRMPSTGAIVSAAYLCGALDHGAESGRQLALRGVTALIWRAEPLARVVQAARALALRQLDVQGFSTVLDAALSMLSTMPKPAELVRTLGRSPVVLPQPEVGPGGPWWPPRKPPFSAWLLPENQAWAHCALGLAQLFKPLPDLPKTSPPPGLVTPASICGGPPPLAGWPLTISGLGFGDQGDWGVAVNGVAARVNSWKDDLIAIETDALRAGCNQLSWTYASSWTPEDNGVGDACLEALRLPRTRLTIGTEALLANLTRFWTHPGSVSVMAPRVAAFTASAGVAAATSACTPVTLAWRIDDLPCLQDRGAMQIRLLRDGQPLATGLPPVGSRIDADLLDRDANYEIELTSADAAGQACAAVRASLRVQRLPKQVRIIGPAQVRSATPVTVELQVPCPAPPGGLAVSLASTPSGSLGHPAVVTIAAGTRSAQVMVTAGPSTCGAATLRAAAADHQDGTWATCVQLPPRIVAFIPPTDLKACERNQLRFDAECVAVPPSLRAFAVGAGGARVALTVSGLGTAGSCAAARTLTVGVPPLPAGTYSLLIENDLGSATAGATFDLAPNPRIVSAPRSVSVNEPCGSGRQRTVTVRVSGADAVEFSYQGTPQTVTRPGMSADCAEWAATFTFDFDRTGTIDVVPKLGSQRGAAQAVAVDLALGVAVSVYRLRGPAFMNVSAQLTRIETAVGGQPTSTPEGSIAAGAVRSFTLTPCVFTTFAFEYEVSGSKVSGSVPEKLGHADGEVLGPIQI